MREVCRGLGLLLVVEVVVFEGIGELSAPCCSARCRYSNVTVWWEQVSMPTRLK